MHPDFEFETARVGEILREDECQVKAEDIERFRRLLGYPPSAPGTQPSAPASMGLTYGLKLGWEHEIFPPGAVRMGDDNVFGVSAKPGDRLTTALRITERWKSKGRKFMKYEMLTRNQRGEMVCSVNVVGMLP